MDLHYRQEITVGTLVLAGVGLFLGGTMWLRGRSFSTAPEVQVVANKRLADALHQTLVAMRRTLEVYSDTRKGPTTELTGTLQSLQRLANRLDSTLATVHVDPTLKRADTLVTSLNTLTTRFTTTGAQLDTLLRRINAGRGTLGKFAQDTTFYDNAQRLLRSLQEFVDELKRHPGKIT